MVSAQEYPNRKSLATTGHRTPLALFFLWGVFEFVPALLPHLIGDDLYWAVYFYAEDMASVMLAMACYFSLSYTSVLLKGVALTIVIISSMLIPCNILVDVGAIPASYGVGLLIILVFSIAQCFMVRFMLRASSDRITNPRDDIVYLIVNKPRNFWGMIGLLWSGIGGGFTAYVAGECYWFSRESGVLVKTTDKNWFRGKQMIDCGEATSEKIADLEALVGQRWSVLNNCFTVFGSWKRRWS